MVRSTDHLNFVKFLHNKTVGDMFDTEKWLQRKRKSYINYSKEVVREKEHPWLKEYSAVLEVSIYALLVRLSYLFVRRWW